MRTTSWRRRARWRGAEPMRGSPGGALRAAQIGGDAGVREPLGGPKEGRFQCHKRRRLAGGGHLGLEPSQDVLEQRCGPLALEEPLGCKVMGRLAAIAILGAGDVDRHDGLAAAALEPPLVVVAVGQVVAHEATRNERNRPLLRSTAARLCLSSRVAKKPWTRSSADSGSCPRRRTNA